MELRKVQETGGGTNLISVPKDWARRSGLSKGSLVAMSVRDDGCLIVDPRYNLARGVEVVTLHPSPYLEREITGRYLLGYDIIQVETERRISASDRDRVKQAVQRLIGLEIIEEDSYKIVLQCLLEPSTFPPEKILRREDLITSGMLKDVMVSLHDGDQHLARSVIERDDEVDRLYFLLVRLLRTTILNPGLTEKLGISLIDCLDYRLVASLIESVADCSVDMAGSILKMSDTQVPSEFAGPLAELGVLVHDIHEKAMRAFFSKDLTLSEETQERGSQAISSIRQLGSVQVDLPSSLATHISEILSSLSRVCDYSVDISDLVMSK